jgi:hypothetical protein
MGAQRVILGVAPSGGSARMCAQKELAAVLYLVIEF